MCAEKTKGKGQGGPEAWGCFPKGMMGKVMSDPKVKECMTAFAKAMMEACSGEAFPGKEGCCETPGDEESAPKD